MKKLVLSLAAFAALTTSLAFAETGIIDTNELNTRVNSFFENGTIPQTLKDQFIDWCKANDYNLNAYNSYNLSKEEILCNGVSLSSIMELVYPRNFTEYKCQ